MEDLTWDALCAHTADLDERGYTIVPEVLDRDTTVELRAAILDRISAARANGGSGAMAARLLDGGSVFGRLATHPIVLALCEHVLGPRFILSQLVGTRRPRFAPRLRLHSDCTYVPNPLPPYGIVATAIWVCDEFTKDGGATRLVPGSHLRRHHPSDEDDANGDVVTIECAPGSLVLWNGATWHGNHRRTARGERVCLHATYNHLTIRPFEHYDPAAFASDPPIYSLVGGNDPFGKSTAAGPDFARMLAAMADFERAP